MIEWDTGETSYEPLSLIVQDDPITCAVYAKKHGLLNTPGSISRNMSKPAKDSSEQPRNTSLDESEKQSSINLAIKSSEIMKVPSG